MAATPDSQRTRAGVGFELHELRREDGRLLVEGRWTGVRGLRFVRPALLVGERELLATLEHKPWAPDADPWRAAFPWDGEDVDAADVALAVAPSVVVPLEPGGHVPQPEPAPRRLVPAREPVRAQAVPVDEPTAPAPAAGPSAEPAGQASPPEAAEPAGQASLLDGAEPEPEAEALEPAEPTAEASPRELERTGGGQERDQLAARLAAVEEERAASEADEERARAAASRDHERLTAQRDEAVRDRAAALRTRSRMEADRDGALAAQRSLEQERDAALADVERIRAQREGALVAHRALERRVAGLLAREADAEPALAVDAAATGRRASASAAPREEDVDVPLGVRAIPAGGALAADLHRAEAPKGARAASVFDLWAIRVVGSVAAFCFLALLVLLLRVFV